MSERSTTAVLITTQDKPVNHNSLYNMGAAMENTWNSEITTSDGGYNLTVDVRHDEKYRVSINRDDIIEARDTAEEEMPDVIRDHIPHDAIVVRDAHEYPGPKNGQSRVGEARYGEQNAGADHDQNVCIVGESVGTGLGLHELAHLYGGKHEHHQARGLWNYTIMGNDGDEQCNGGTSPSWKSRDRHFNKDCGDSATMASREYIRLYMDWWNTTNDSF